MERLLWIIHVSTVNSQGFLKLGEGGRTGGQSDEMQERFHPPPIAGLEDGRREGTMNLGIGVAPRSRNRQKTWFPPKP